MRDNDARRITRSAREFGPSTVPEASQRDNRLWSRFHSHSWMVRWKEGAERKRRWPLMQKQHHVCEYCGKPCNSLEELKKHDIECILTYKKR
jgi:hypothetical protein